MEVETIADCMIKKIEEVFGDTVICPGMIIHGAT